MSYISISKNDGTYSLVHAEDEGAYLARHLLKKSIKERIRNNGYY